MRNLRYFLVTFAVVPSVLQAAEPVRVERDGYSFEYIVDRKPDGRRVIIGRDLDADRTFRLLVRGRRVTGEIGDRQVDFKMPRIRSSSKPTVIASK